MTAAIASHDIALPIPLTLPSRRQELAAYIEGLIDLLDATEPDPDFEPQGDEEPSIAGHPLGDDLELDDSDREPEDFVWIAAAYSPPSRVPLIGAAISGRSAVASDRHLSTAIINGQPVVFDVNDIDFDDGDLAVGFDWEGDLIVQPMSVRDFGEVYRPGGNRLQLGPPHKDEYGATRRASFFIIGKVAA